MTALVIGLDRRLNLSEEVPKQLLQSDGMLQKHEGDTDALFLTMTKTTALKIRYNVFKVLMASANSQLDQRLYWCFVCQEYRQFLQEFCRSDCSVRSLLKQDQVQF